MGWVEVLGGLRCSTACTPADHPLVPTRPGAGVCQGLLPPSFDLLSADLRATTEATLATLACPLSAEVVAAIEGQGYEVDWGADGNRRQARYGPLDEERRPLPGGHARGRDVLASPHGRVAHDIVVAGARTRKLDAVPSEGRLAYIAAHVVAPPSLLDWRRAGWALLDVVRTGPLLELALSLRIERGCRALVLSLDFAGRCGVPRPLDHAHEHAYERAAFHRRDRMPSLRREEHRLHGRGVDLRGARGASTC